MRTSLLPALIFFFFAFAASAETPPPVHQDEAIEMAGSDAHAVENSEKEKRSHSPDASKAEDAFCEAIVDPAREQRYLLKQKELEVLLASVNERIAELEKRKAEHEEWVRRREEFAKRATTNLVEIYATMKPEAAASRLSELNLELAASLLLAITPRQASSILNEMDEKKAADLTNIMSVSARKKDPS